MKHIIIGNSAAGIAAIRTLRSLDKDAQIICISDEKERPYNKCFLADYMSGERAERQTYTLTEQQVDQLRVNMRFGLRVINIASDNKSIMLQDGLVESYDTLLLATGTRPMLPRIKNVDAYRNVFTFHNLKGAQKLSSFIKQRCPKKAVVIGAGLSGIEIADALTVQSIDVQLIERSNQLLAAHITHTGSQVLEQAMVRAGVTLHANKTVHALEGNGQEAQTVSLSDGTVINTDLVVVTAGLRQNSELAQTAQLTCDQYGLVVNEYMQTSDPHIYAAGDIISTIDLISGRRIASCTWPDAMQQGRHAAYAMAGKQQAYKGAHIITSSAFFGLKFYSCGSLEGTDYTAIEQRSDQTYERYLIKNGQLKGFQLLGDGRQFASLRRAVMSNQPLPDMVYTESKKKLISI